ncbi:MAG: acetyl-CoA carboxylase carboxyltransferase subunit beta [Nitrospinae bacterium]|nr:acetyl-CoA carboxylase carboxyltransferase subunit beta [Nitrospinota bacterium]
MSWFTRVKKPLEKIARKGGVPGGLWRKCDGCKEIIYNTEFERNFNVCPKCDYHHRLGARRRISLLLDEGSFVEKDTNLHSSDPLRFRDSKKYKDRLLASQKKTGGKDSVVSGSGLMSGRGVEIASMEFEFMGGSMGAVAGEKITRTMERGLANNRPVIVVSCSGGARMQEGILSLMQMAKTSAAAGMLAEKKIPFISVLADPTSGGVTASFAMLGDIIIAEPGALICFAGPRVIAQTIKETLPEGFQRAEFLLDHGFVDMVVHRYELKAAISGLLDYMKPGGIY